MCIRASRRCLRGCLALSAPCQEMRLVPGEDVFVVRRRFGKFHQQFSRAAGCSAEGLDLYEYNGRRARDWDEIFAVARLGDEARRPKPCALV